MTDLWSIKITKKDGIITIEVDGKTVPPTDKDYDSLIDKAVSDMESMMGGDWTQSFMKTVYCKSNDETFSSEEEPEKGNIRIRPRKIRHGEPIMYAEGYGYDEVGPKDKQICLQDSVDNSISKAVNTIRYEYSLAMDAECPEYEHDINKLTRIRELIQDLYGLRQRLLKM